MQRVEIPVGRSRDPDEFREPIARLVRSQLGGEVIGLEPIAAGLGTRLFLRVRLTGSPVSSAIARIEMPEDPAGRPAGMPSEPALGEWCAILDDPAFEPRPLAVRVRTRPMVERPTANGSRLTPANVRAIRNDHRTFQKIAADMGVNASTIGRVKNGDTWAWVN